MDAPENHNQKVIIRFNSMIQQADYSMRVGPEFESTTAVEIYGNIAVNPSEEYLRTFYEGITTYNNLTQTGDIGFVDPANGDLHLMSNSQAIDFCVGLPAFPTTDIDGDPRDSNTLDAGADEL